MGSCWIVSLLSWAATMTEHALHSAKHKYYIGSRYIHYAKSNNVKMLCLYYMHIAMHVYACALNMYPRNAFPTYQSFLRMVSLLWRGLPLPAAAVVQPILQVWRSISNEGMLKQIAPVLHGTPMPPPLP